MANGPQGNADETSGTGAYAGLVVGIVLACGAVLPGERGLGWTTIAALVAGSLAAARLRARGTASWAAIVRARGPGARVALVLAIGFAATVLAAVAARIVAQLVIAFPGALPGVAIVLLVVLLRPRELGVARWVLGPLVLVAAFLGARCESEGEAARGSMHSGAIHGIHPFQTTAILVDGYGPHDLPINDYVEPIGDRGYNPTELAAAIELALHRIAQVHYAEGPARARLAFAEATAGAVETDPIRERLDRDPPSGTQPRFWVRSGTTGQRSKVEFVCPGRRDDPRGPQPETIMNRMCPDKYANEASAGLSVTGRWPGYVEVRGNERMGLSQLLGWTRSDDATGIALVELERWLWVVVVMALAVIAAVLARRSHELASSSLPLVLPLAVLVAIAALHGSDLGRIPLFARAPAWADPWQPSAWLPVLVWPAAAALACWLSPREGGRARGIGGLAFVALALAWLAATDLSAAQWLAPAWQGQGPTAAIEPWVIAFADAVLAALPDSLSPSILDVEAMVAASIAAPCILVVAQLVTATAATAELAVPEPSRPAARKTAAIAVALVAVALAWSRKTDGGVALIPAAIGVALACGSAMQRFAARGPWPRSHVSVLAIAIHVAWTALALWLVAGTAPADGDPLRWLYTGLAGLAVLAPLVACVPDPDPAPGGASPRGSGA